MNCRDCKHWREPIGYGEEPRDGSDVAGKRICAMANTSSNTLSIAVCMGEVGIDGELFTAPDFGCVLFGRAPEKETDQTRTGADQAPDGEGKHANQESGG